MHNLIRHIVSLSLLTALTGACVEKEGETTEDTTGGSSGDSTGGTSGDSTGDETGATEGSSGSDSATGETGETGEPTTGEPTTGASEGLCEAYAQWSVMCEEFEPGNEAEAVSECEMQREFYDEVFGPECGAKTDAYLECAATHGCDDEAACATEIEAVENCTPAAGATCKAYAAKVIACEPGDDEAEIASSCQFEVNAGKFSSPACGTASDALYACLAGLECPDLFDGTGCDAEIAMQEASCPGEDFGPVQSGELEFETHRR